MKIGRLAVTVASLSAFPIAAQAPPPSITPTRSVRTDAEICEYLRALAESTTRELPMMVDTVTRFDGMSAICALRTITWNKFVMADESSFREGWQDRKQAQFNQLICGNEAFEPMARRGWRFVQNLTFQSGGRYVMEARCDG